MEFESVLPTNYSFGDLVLLHDGFTLDGESHSKCLQTTQKYYLSTVKTLSLH